MLSFVSHILFPPSLPLSPPLCAWMPFSPCLSLILAPRFPDSPGPACLYLPFSTFTLTASLAPLSRFLQLSPSCWLHQFYMMWVHMNLYEKMVSLLLKRSSKSDWLCICYIPLIRSKVKALTSQPTVIFYYDRYSVSIILSWSFFSGNGDYTVAVKLFYKLRLSIGL